MQTMHDADVDQLLRLRSKPAPDSARLRRSCACSVSIAITDQQGRDLVWFDRTSDTTNSPSVPLP